MDPVSRVLVERERSAPRFFPWVVVAAVLHGSLFLAGFLAGRSASARPAQLPSVSVRIVRPERLPGQRTAAAKPKPKPTMAAPTPVPTAAPTKAPAPVPTAPSERQPSEDAMAAQDAEPTPRPTAIPEPQTSPGSRGGGLSLGGDDGAEIPGIPSDFHFTYYIERMLTLIETRWYKPGVPEGTSALVRFRIHRDGRVDRIELEESSGHPTFDRAALRALFAANPLPPLPPAYGRTSLTVHLRFSE
jgi:TonB family protein